MTRAKTVRIVRWAAGITALAVGLLILLFSPEPPPPHPLQTAFYVWQLQWNDSVREAVVRSAPKAQEFMVLIGEVGAKGGELAYYEAQPDWEALGKSAVPVTLVLRANAALGEFLAEASLKRTGAFVVGKLKASASVARAKGVRVAGAQLDFDSPTSKLPEYAQLLTVIRTEMPRVPLSITVLPTWLKSWQFSKLVNGLAYYVLQVHSLEKPTDADDPIVLCNASKIPGYLRRASSEKAPFYLALPTYGYRVAFDTTGKFVALSAESPAPPWGPTYQVRTVMADPEELAHVVSKIHDAAPANCLGIAWFRLPVSTDELNWSWATLQAVMAGQEPEVEFAVEMKTPQPGLYEVWVSNIGEVNVLEQIRLDVEWGGVSIVAHDVLRGFTEHPRNDNASTVLTGPSPKTGSPVQAAWFRVDAKSKVPENPIKVTRVEIVK